jgi:hypothetical protein
VASFFLAFHQNPICSPLLPHPCYMPCPSHPPLLYNYTWRTIQVMKLLIMQLSPTSYQFIPLWSKYFPRHPVLKPPQSMFLP